MKNIYLFLATTFTWFSFINFTAAQTFTSTFVSTGAGGNWSAGTSWVGGVSPGAICDNCKITIAPFATVSIDIPVQLKGATNPSFLIIQANATLTVDKPLRLDNMTELLVGNDGTST